METMPYLWTENLSNDEIKHRLLRTKMELITARMEANAELKKHEEIIKRLFKLLKRVCQERDEARDQLQLLLRYLHPSSPCTPPETNRSIPFPPLDHPQPSMESTKKSDTSSKDFYHRSCELSLASLQPSYEKVSSIGFSHTVTSESSNLALLKQQQHPMHQNKTGTNKADMGFSRDGKVDSASSLMIDKLVCGKPLPQKGRLLRAVAEAGPLLQTLLVAPLPEWQNPPSLSSFCLPPNCTHGNDSSSSNVDVRVSVNANGVIPTTLSLAFPGNSLGLSLPSVSGSGSGFSLKNEPTPCVGVDSDMMHNHTLSAKRRKLL